MRIPFELSIQAVVPSRVRLSHLFCLLPMILGGGASVQAAAITSYYVATSSIAHVAGAPGGSATYNTNTGATMSGTGTGTANVTGLTSSFDQSSASGFGVLPPNLPLNGSSFAAADLSAALVRASATGNEADANNGAVSLGDGTGIAEIFDTLTFHVSGPNVTGSTVTDIGINTSLDGAVTNLTAHGSYVINDTLLISGGAADVQFLDNTSNSPNIAVNQFGWVSENVLSSTTSSFIFQGVTSGLGATFSIPIDLKLNVFCAGATCDYSNTGTLTLSLPSNVTFTSASSVFLSAPQSGVPEPSSWAMTVAGLIAALGIAWKHRRSIRVNS